MKQTTKFTKSLLNTLFDKLSDLKILVIATVSPKDNKLYLTLPSTERLAVGDTNEPKIFWNDSDAIIAQLKPIIGDDLVIELLPPSREGEALVIKDKSDMKEYSKNVALDFVDSLNNQ